MSAQQTKQFQQGERVIPAAAEKAPKYYQAEDDSQAKKVCNTLRPPYAHAPERMSRKSWT
jgi:large subunit ribosomal protein L6e